MVRNYAFASHPHGCLMQLTGPKKANFPNLRRLFIEARTDDEERDVSRKAVRNPFAAELERSHHRTRLTDSLKFYNAVLFMGSVAVFSLIAQKLNAGK
jgi:hypothetical protein